MAREVQEAMLGETEYIVDIDDNRQDEDPFGVVLLPMTAAEVNAIERSAGEFTGGKINFTERAQLQVREIFAKRVVRVWNYSIPHKKTRERIRPQTGLGLYLAILEHGDEHESKVIDDIVQAVKLQSHLRKGLRETLSSQSDAQVLAMMSGAGAAGSAGATT